MCCQLPMYGFERRGAPVVAFTRFDDKQIMEKTQIYNPDCLVVIDPGLLKLPTLFTGLNPNGTLILNSSKVFDKQPNENLKLAGVVNATQIAVEEVGRDVPNTCLLALLLPSPAGWLAIRDGQRRRIFRRRNPEENLRCVERGYNEVK